MKEFDACHMFTLYRFMQLDLPPIMECMYLIFIHIQALHAMWTTSELIFPLFSPGFLTTNQLDNLIFWVFAGNICGEVPQFQQFID
jgi:hypothetical protein